MPDGPKVGPVSLSPRGGYRIPSDACANDYLKEVNGEPVTAADVALATGLDKRQVDGIFTSAIQRKGLGIRTEAEIEKEDGTHAKVKFLSLTPEGMNFDPDAE